MDAKTILVMGLVVTVGFAAAKLHAHCKARYDYSFFERGVFGWWGVGLLLLIAAAADWQGGARLADASVWAPGMAALLICGSVVLKNFVRTGFVLGALGTGMQVLLWPFAVAAVILVLVALVGAVVAFKGVGVAVDPAAAD